MDLRRPNDFQGYRYGQVNMGSENHPKWQLKVDIMHKEGVEIIRNPSYHTLDTSTNNCLHGIHGSNNNSINHHSNSISYSGIKTEYMNNTLETNNISMKEYYEVVKLVV